jgi:hypothetical protein
VAVTAVTAAVLATAVIPPPAVAVVVATPVATAVVITATLVITATVVIAATVAITAMAVVPAVVGLLQRDAVHRRRGARRGRGEGLRPRRYRARKQGGSRHAGETESHAHTHSVPPV